MNQRQHEQANIRAYVVGFILSLVFTLIPYYLVVNHVVSGTALLLIILGFGVLQMLVQVIFFLHIGRSPQQNWQLIFLIMTVITILVVVGGSIVITRNLHYNMNPIDQTKKLVNDEAIYQIGGEKTGACEGQHANHQIRLRNDVVDPVQIFAKQCDTLTFINEGDEVKDIKFGEQHEHLTYAGEEEYIIRKGHNKTITLSELGTYRFHDHLQPDAFGYFTVTP